MGIILALAALLWSAAFLQPMHILPWVSWHSEVLAFTSVALLAWRLQYLTTVYRPASRIAIPRVTLPFLGLAALICIQWGTGLLSFGGDAVAYVSYFVLCALCVILGYANNGKKAEISLTLIAATLVISAFASAALAFAQVLEIANDYSWINMMQFARRPGANLGQPNQLATLLLMGLVSVSMLYERKKLTAIVCSLAAINLIIALAITESRAGVLGFVVLALWWYAKGRNITTRITPKIMAFGCVGFLSMFWIWPAVWSEIFQIQKSVPEINTVAYNRWIIWPQIIESVLLRPWFGWGFGQVSTAHNAVVDAYIKSEPYTYAHNIILDFAVGVGVPLTLLLLGVTVLWLKRRWGMVREQETWYCIALAIPVGVHSLFEFPFAYAYFLVPVMIALGTLERTLDQKPAFFVDLKVFGLAIFAATVPLIWSAVEYVEIEEDFRIVRFEALRYGQTPQSYTRPDVHVLTQLDALLHAARLTPAPNMSKSDIELARTVALRFPWSATQNRYALALALNGEPSEAVRQLKVMRALHGAKQYALIKQAWAELASEKYPVLRDIQLPE